MMKPLLPYEKIKREILVKKESKISEKYGSTPEKRDIKELLNTGVICINKPRGPTSHQISEFVQKILGIKKAGHSGTLDPKVTGVLVVTLDKGTKAAQGLLKAGKEYI